MSSPFHPVSTPPRPPAPRWVCRALPVLALLTLPWLAAADGATNDCLTLAARADRLFAGYADRVEAWQLATSNTPARGLASFPLPAPPRQLLPLGPSLLALCGDAGAVLLPTTAGTTSAIVPWLGAPRPALAAAERRGLLAVAAGPNGVWFYAVEPEASPRLLGVFPAAVDARAVGFVASLLCVADGTNGLKFLDLSSPAQPEVVGVHAPPDAPPVAALTISTTLIATAHERQVRLLDASDPRHPMLTATHELPAPVRGLVLALPRLWVACGEAGLLELDAVHALKEVRRHPTRGPALAVAAEGGRVFVAEGEAGWREVSAAPR